MWGKCSIFFSHFNPTLISEMTIGGIPQNDMITTWAGLSDLFAQPTNVFFYFTYPRKSNISMNEYKALDIQGLNTWGSLCFGPPKHTYHKNQTSRGAWLSREELLKLHPNNVESYFIWCKCLVGTNIILSWACNLRRNDSNTHQHIFLDQGNLIFI